MAHLSPFRPRYSLSPLSQSFRRFVWRSLQFPAIQPILRYAAIPRQWLVGGALLLLLLWNWQLVLSLGLGLLTLAIGYLLQQGQGKRLWAACQRWWQSIDRSFVMTVGSSLLVIGISYLTLAIWQEIESFWLAIGFLLEGVGILAGLGLLGWLVWRQTQDNAHESSVSGGAIASQWLTDLADADPLKRLLAVRQLTHVVGQDQSAVLLTSEELAESFRLMLNRETEAIVCRALLESLQRLDAPTPAFAASQQPEVQMTTRIKTPVEWEE